MENWIRIKKIREMLETKVTYGQLYHFISTQIPETKKKYVGGQLFINQAAVPTIMQKFDNTGASSEWLTVRQLMDSLNEKVGKVLYSYGAVFYRVTKKLSAEYVAREDDNLRVHVSAADEILEKYSTPDRQAHKAGAALTAMEQSIIDNRIVAQKMTLQEIATIHNVSRNGVHLREKKLRNKLGLTNNDTDNNNSERPAGDVVSDNEKSSDRHSIRQPEDDTQTDNK